MSTIEKYRNAILIIIVLYQRAYYWNLRWTIDFKTGSYQNMVL